jgi:hypothetical protein
MVSPHRRASRRPAEFFTFTWRDYQLRLVHTPDVVNLGWSHLALTVLTPVGAPLPLSLTAGHVLELDEEELLAAGGPVAFLTDKLERAAGSFNYERAMFRWRQGSLL